MANDLHRDILALGVEGEDVALAEVVGLVRHRGLGQADQTCQLETALAAVTSLVDAGAVTVGTITEGVFKESPVVDLTQRARDTFDGNAGGQGAYALWLRNTSTGDAMVRDLPRDYDPFADDAAE